MALTALQIKHAKEGTHPDGNGLYLQVAKAGTKSWIYRYQIAGRRREMGLGSLADRSAVEARAEVAKLRTLVKAKVDPLEVKRLAALEEKERQAATVVQGMTFRKVALEYIAAKRAEWSNEKHTWQWENSLTLVAFPVFGSVPVGNVTTDLVLAALTPIWISKTETATRVRQRIEKVLDYAAFKKWRTGENPARWRGHLEHTLPKPNSVRVVQHQPALPYRQVSEFMAELRAREGTGARALEFAILTAARSGEVRGARWPEIDLETKVWTVPAARMKGKKEHRVPLSTRAVELLKALPRIEGEELVFPGSKPKTPMSDMTLKAAVVRINKDRNKTGLPMWTDAKSGVPIVPHGFRSTFRDWAAEVTHYPNEMAEMAVAHVVNNKVEAAYRRGDMFEKRRQMMEDWATWCEPKRTGEVVPIVQRAA